MAGIQEIGKRRIITNGMKFTTKDNDIIVNTNQIDTQRFLPGEEEKAF